MSEKEITRKTEIDRAMDKRITQKRGQPSNRKTAYRVMEAVKEFITGSQTQGFCPTFMTEKLYQMKGINLSKETIRCVMIETGVWKAKTKKTKKIPISVGNEGIIVEKRCKSMGLHTHSWRIADPKPVC